MTLVLSLALTGTACADDGPPPLVEDAVTIRALALELPDEKHSLSDRELRWVAGFDLEGGHERFGGFSGLLVEGERLLAVSDRGYWLHGTLELADGGELLGVRDAVLWPILDLDGAAVSGRDRHDAEELAHHAGGLVVAFEGEHRLHLYGREDGQLRPTARVPRLLPSPPMADVEENGGLEAVTSLADGRLLALTEDGRTEDGRIRAFLSTSDAFASGASTSGPSGELEWLELTVQETEDYKPTGAATLPDGDVLLVERSFHPLRGVRIRVSVLAAADLEAVAAGGADAPLTPRELGRLQPPLPVDNIEAVDVARTAGRTFVYLLADDNFHGLQDTLLIQLELVTPGER